MIDLRRNRLVSAAVALSALATFLGASMGEARGLDPCPHHDWLPGNLAHAASGQGHGHDMAMGTDVAHPDGHGHGSDKHEGHGPCNCVGCSCAGGAPTVVVAGAPEIAIAPAAIAELAPPSSASELVPSKDEGWIPYLPQAPPVSV